MKSIIIGVILFANLLAMSADLSHENTQLTQKVPFALISKIEGKAKVLPADSIKKHQAVRGEYLFKGDKLISYADSMVLLELADSSKVVLNENAELTFVDRERLRQGSGEIYYRIKKRVSSKGLKVETPFSIIGIKGTEFIVNSAERGEIALNEGLIGIEALHAEFELHKKKVMSEYEAFKSKQIQEFEAYKAQRYDEVVSYVKTFELEASKSLHFDDARDCEQACESKVSEFDFTAETKKRFEHYQKIVEE